MSRFGHSEHWPHRSNILDQVLVLLPLPFFLKPRAYSGFLVGGTGMAGGPQSLPAKWEGDPRQEAQSSFRKMLSDGLSFHQYQ